MTTNKKIYTGNQAVANIAYKTNEVCAIYPCTPSTEMSEQVEKWNAKKIKNVFGKVPSVFQMQSEAGVAGAMHGALQGGSLATTFTASQGLLLMIPNMYKIAGQLIPNVIHVATRSIASHALSIFGDHSDIMATRQTGYAFLGSASVQEAQDFALISQASSLYSRIPFVHFFDGFRTSHEYNTIELIQDDVIKSLIDSKSVGEHRNRALNPKNPVIKGTAQGSDVFFQSREAQNAYYNACPDIVQSKMNTFGDLTGRHYKIFEYVGHPKAEHIIISMASSTETIEATINQLNENNNKYGLIKVRLFRPFSKKHLLKALPETVKSIAVLDRTKEPGSSGEPLYLDILQVVSEAFQNNEIDTLPRIIGGRYGLSSKEFTPTMVSSIFNNLKSNQPKNNFTVGIVDDLTKLSLKNNKEINLKHNQYQAIFYTSKSKQNSVSFENLLKTINNEANYIQGYTECDYKKSNSRNVSHLRISKEKIKASYLITQADFVFCQNTNFIENDNALINIKFSGTLLVNSSLKPQEFWQTLSVNTQNIILEKELQLLLIDLKKLQKNLEINNKTISNVHAYFLSVNEKLFYSEELLNIAGDIIEVNTKEFERTGKSTNENLIPKTLIKKLQTNSSISVSDLPVDGVYPTNTSQFNPKQNSKFIPTWDTEACTQCGLCSLVCPQGSLRIKAYKNFDKTEAPSTFKSMISQDFDLMHYTIQNNSDQCNGCNNCIDACPAKALVLEKRADIEKNEQNNWAYFDTIPEIDRNKINSLKLSEQQLQEPLFKYSIGIEGCGEAAYLKLLSQLFGDRLVVANATGASSIFGGSLPTTPWSKNNNGQGPAWANSLFEDNAEFGLGIKMALENQQRNDETVWIVGGDGWAYDIGYGGIDHVLSSGKNVNILVLDNEVYDNTGGQSSKATPYGAQAEFNYGCKQKRKKDLGQIALQYDNVYVASVAIGANPEQALQAFNEAEKHNGTSIIIAYCHSESHGINMKTPSKYHKAIVNSGQWLLYRNDPRRASKGLNSFQLDSEPPKIKIEDYLCLEKRFSKTLGNKSLFNESIGKIQKQIDSRYDEFLTKSKSQDLTIKTIVTH